MTKYFIITREQVRAKPSWFDKELRNWSRGPPYVSISVLQECYYLHVCSQYESPAHTQCLTSSHSVIFLVPLLAFFLPLRNF